MPTTRSSSRQRPSSSQSPVRVRRSPIHGTGVFATRALRRGERIIEYLGERISHEEANRRHSRKAADDNHTFLFTLDEKTVIDGGVRGNEARYINHSCDPNCKAYWEDGDIVIYARRAIAPGEELVYDYGIGRDPDDPPGVDQTYACRCGAAKCRGTMLEPLKKPRRNGARAKKR